MILKGNRMFLQFTGQKVKSCINLLDLVSLGLTGIQKWAVPYELFLDRKTKIFNSSPC